MKLAKDLGKKIDIAVDFGIKQNSLSTIFKNWDAIFKVYESTFFSRPQEKECDPLVAVMLRQMKVVFVISITEG